MQQWFHFMIHLIHIPLQQVRELHAAEGVVDLRRRDWRDGVLESRLGRRILARPGARVPGGGIGHAGLVQLLPQFLRYIQFGEGSRVSLDVRMGRRDARRAAILAV